MSILPLPARDPAPDHAARVGAELRAAFARFAGAARRARIGGDDEAVHDLRVAARRLDAALDVWRDALAPRAVRRLRAALRRLRRNAGPARELEVHHDELGDALDDGGTDAARASLEALRARWAEQRDAARRTVARRASRARAMRLRRRLRRALRALAGPFAPALDPFGAARTRVERRRRRALDALLEARERTDDEALHAARLAIKKWRYAEETLGRVRAADLSAASSTLRSLQRWLGTVHDAATFRDHLIAEASERLRHQDAAGAASLASLASAAEHRRLEALRRLRPRLAQPLAPRD